VVLKADFFYKIHIGLQDFYRRMTGKNVNEQGYNSFGDQGIAVCFKIEFSVFPGNV